MMRRSSIWSKSPFQGLLSSVNCRSLGAGASAVAQKAASPNIAAAADITNPRATSFHLCQRFP
jgi:hypothetical protein